MSSPLNRAYDRATLPDAMLPHNPSRLDISVFTRPEHAQHFVNTWRASVESFDQNIESAKGLLRSIQSQNNQESISDIDFQSADSVLIYLKLLDEMPLPENPQDLDIFISTYLICIDGIPNKMDAYKKVTDLFLNINQKSDGPCSASMINLLAKFVQYAVYVGDFFGFAKYQDIIFLYIYQGLEQMGMLHPSECNDELIDFSTCPNLAPFRQPLGSLILHSSIAASYNGDTVNANRLMDIGDSYVIRVFSLDYAIAFLGSRITSLIVNGPNAHTIGDFQKYCKKFGEGVRQLEIFVANMPQGDKKQTQLDICRGELLLYNLYRRYYEAISSDPIRLIDVAALIPELCTLEASEIFDQEDRTRLVALVSQIRILLHAHGSPVTPELRNLGSSIDTDYRKFLGQNSRILLPALIDRFSYIVKNLIDGTTSEAIDATAFKRAKQTMLSIYKLIIGHHGSFSGIPKSFQKLQFFQDFVDLAKKVLLRDPVTDKTVLSILRRSNIEMELMVSEIFKAIGDSSDEQIRVEANNIDGLSCIVVSSPQKTQETVYGEYTGSIADAQFATIQTSILSNGIEYTIAYSPKFEHDTARQNGEDAILAYVRNIFSRRNREAISEIHKKLDTLRTNFKPESISHAVTEALHSTRQIRDLLSAPSGRMETEKAIQRVGELERILNGMRHQARMLPFMLREIDRVTTMVQDLLLGEQNPSTSLMKGKNKI